MKWIRKSHWLYATLAWLPLGAIHTIGHAADTTQPGLMANYQSKAANAQGGPGIDQEVSPRLQLFTKSDQSPTPRLSPGPFQVTWQGYISLELRSDMIFQAEVEGTFLLEVDGNPVLSFTGKPGQSTSPLSKPIRMGKGTNYIKASLSSPAEGNTMLRVAWGEEPTQMSLIPEAALSFDKTQFSPANSSAFLQGRELALEHRCFHCHNVSPQQGIPELGMDAPSFTGIGSRRQLGWMTAWIRNPKALRSTALMPVLLHGDQSADDAKAMAAFLASLDTGGEVTIPISRAKPLVREEGAEQPISLFEDPSAPLYEGLHCNVCHVKGGETDEDPMKLSLAGVAEKFSPGKLAEFLRQPEAHYDWIRMPNFSLSPEEAKELADYLTESAAAPASPAPPTNPALLARGKELVQTTGCLNCHELELENRYTAPSFAKLGDWTRGCLSPERVSGDSSKTPRFDFSRDEAQALMAFAKDKQEAARSLAHVPAEFAERQTRLLNCRACHGPFEGFPGFENLGAKLKPEWTRQFLAGELSYRPRPWLRARMPLFRTRSQELAQGLSQAHGFAPQTPEEPPIDLELAGIGLALAGKDGGFSCVSCHGINDQKAAEVFEAEGINLGYATARLQKPFYHRWLTNPLLIDPQTKMPMYFDQGMSPLTEILDGSAERQIEALWQYFRQGKKMPKANMGDF